MRIRKQSRHKRCYIVMEGGGVKAAALVGALHKLEEEGASPVGLAGSSAGAIVAALSAVGYKASEIYEELEKKDFKEFLDGFDSDIDIRNAFRELADIKPTIWNINKYKKVKEKYKLGEAWKRINEKKGLYIGDNFYLWLKNLIEKRGPKDDSGRVTIKSVCSNGKKIKIVASNLKWRKIEILDEERYGTMELADAVRASMAIPLFFEPHINGENYFVDGGLVSNYPAWLFKEENKKNPFPIIGISLQPSIGKQVDTLLDYLAALINTGLEASNNIQNVDSNVITIPVRSGEYSTFDFGITKQDKEILFSYGYQDVSAFIKKEAGKFKW